MSYTHTREANENGEKRTDSVKVFYSDLKSCRGIKHPKGQVAVSSAREQSKKKTGSQTYT